MDTRVNTSNTPPAQHREPKRADARRNRGLLLDAARAIFKRDGLRAQMDEVAAHAGLGVGTLYRHFSTKDALIAEIIKDRHASLTQSARKAAEAGDPWEGLQEFLWHLAQGQAENRFLADILADPKRRDEYRAFGARYRDVIAPMVQRAQAAGQIRPDVSTGDIIVGIGMIAKTTHYGLEDGTGRWRRLIRVMLDGLQVRPPAGTLRSDA